MVIHEVHLSWLKAHVIAGVIVEVQFAFLIAFSCTWISMTGSVLHLL